jgi:hypothetical protein
MIVPNMMSRRKLNHGAFDDVRMRAMKDQAYGSDPKVIMPIFWETGNINMSTGSPETELVAQVEAVTIDARKYLDSVRVA